MYAIAYDHVGEICHGVSFSEAEPQIVVFGYIRERSPITADGEQGVASNHHAAVHERVPLVKHSLDLVIAGRDVNAEQAVTGLVDNFGSAAQEDHVRPGPQEVQLALEPIVQTDVVRIHSGDIRAGYQRTTSVGRRRDPRVRLMDHLDTRIAGRVGIQNRRSSIGRAVIDDQNVELSNRLRHNALERRGQVRLAVEHRHHHRYFRHETSLGWAVRLEPGNSQRVLVLGDRHARPCPDLPERAVRLSSAHSIALEGLRIDRGAEAGGAAESDDPGLQAERLRHHVARHLEGPDRFASGHDRVADGGDGGLGQRAQGQAEAVPDDDAKAGRGRALHHVERPQQPALLHHLDFHDVGRLAPDYLDQRRGASHALIGHEGDADLPADPGEAGDVVTSDRLLDEGEPVWFQLSDEGHSLPEGQALVEVHAKIHARADGGPHRGHPVDAVISSSRHLDLGGREAAGHPVERLAGRLLWWHGADPRVERDLVLHLAAQQ